MLYGITYFTAAVAESRVTILCFSKDYLVSSWQSYEALLAHHMDPAGWKKRIIPIMVESKLKTYTSCFYLVTRGPDFVREKDVGILRNQYQNEIHRVSLQTFGNVYAVCWRAGCNRDK